MARGGGGVDPESKAVVVKPFKRGSSEVAVPEGDQPPSEQPIVGFVCAFVEDGCHNTHDQQGSESVPNIFCAQEELQIGQQHDLICNESEGLEEDAFNSNGSDPTLIETSWECNPHPTPLGSVDFNHRKGVEENNDHVPNQPALKKNAVKPKLPVSNLYCRRTASKKNPDVPLQQEIATPHFMELQLKPMIFRPLFPFSSFVIKWNIFFQWLSMISYEIGSLVKLKKRPLDGTYPIMPSNRHINAALERVRCGSREHGTFDWLKLAKVGEIVERYGHEKLAKTVLCWKKYIEHSPVIYKNDETKLTFLLFVSNKKDCAIASIALTAKNGETEAAIKLVHSDENWKKSPHCVVCKFEITGQSAVIHSKISTGIMLSQIYDNESGNKTKDGSSDNGVNHAFNFKANPNPCLDTKQAVNKPCNSPEKGTKVWTKKISKKAKKLKKKIKRAAHKAKRFCQKCTRFVPCLPDQKCKTLSTVELAEPYIGVDWSHTNFDFKAYYPAEEPDNKQPSTHMFKDENARWASFHKLGNHRLPTQTLARNGFFLNDNHLAQCHGCSRVSELFVVASDPSSGFHHYPDCQYLTRGPAVEHQPTTSRLREVASDTPGRISDDIRDPPGQQSVYIPPGDVRTESYRLSTFEQFPVTCPISRKSLAQSGFYFTGFFDRVKCFACGRTVERWEATDNPADFRWHKDTCPFPRGEECGNVAITSLFNRFHGSVSTRSTTSNPAEEVLEQRDPATGAIIRTVRYPRDLPQRIRQSGGTFQIGPNNQIHIQSGPGSGPSRNPGLRENPQPARLVPTPSQQAQHQPMRQWRMANVISADHKRFLTNLFLYRELDRVASFARWPTGRPNVAPAALARSGFFYLGDMDRTQCFSCGGVLRNWTSEDDAAAEHRTHFPNCKMVLGTETRNRPVPELPVAVDERQRDFPCRFPANPHMRSEAARLETFDRRWPMGRTAATPAEIAQAGFFFLGERDRVKCWYCNGGLQHWEYDDMPWIEHAKWFPNCQYLLSVKGQHFVYRHLAMNPQLPRPIIARQDGSPLDPGTEPRSVQQQPPGDIPPSPRNVRQPSPPPTIIDPQEEMRKKREKVENVLKNSDIVKNVLAMGFSERAVRILLLEKVESGTEENPNDIYDSVARLLDDVMKKEDELREQDARSNQAAAASPSMPGTSSFMPSVPSEYSSMSTPQSSLGPAPGSGKYNVSYFGDEDEEEKERDMYGTEPMDQGQSSLSSVTPVKQVQGGEENTASLQEALNKIEEERMCKICFTNQADMVFVPCGHMCCCMQCTQAIRQCPMCRVRIEKAIKTYLS